VSPGVYLALLAVGAAAVALWTYVRFPRLTPATFTRALVAAGVALVAWNLFGRLAVQVLENPSSTRLLLALMCFVFAPLAALFLTVIWIMKAAIESLGPHIR
jgi:hypothetical protein